MGRGTTFPGIGDREEEERRSRPGKTGCAPKEKSGQGLDNGKKVFNLPFDFGMDQINSKDDCSATEVFGDEDTTLE